MNFDKIKEQMDADARAESKLITTINLKKGTNNPVSKIKRNMKFEIIAQLVVVVLLFLTPSIKPMEKLPESLFYIFIFIIGLIGVGYSIKLMNFLKKSSAFELNTKDALKDFIHECKLTLEVIKSLSIALSFLLPIPIFILITGTKASEKIDTFNKWIYLDLSAIELVGLIFGAIVVAIIMYYLVNDYIKILYTKYVLQLEESLKMLDV